MNTMQRIHHSHRFFAFCLLCSLLLLLNACGKPSQASGSKLSSASPTTQTSPSPTASDSEMAQTCPTQNTGRAAIMPPTTIGKHPTIVYLAHQSDNHSLLQSYDTVTGTSQTIMQTRYTAALRTANISTDGEWILIVSLLQGQSALQLVRLDGQHLQTLYCAPTGSSIDNALLSPDNHFLIFNQEDQNEMSILYLLDLTTGTLHTELSPHAPSFPGVINPPQANISPSTPFVSIHNSAAKQLEYQQFQPVSGTHYLIYIPMKWTNNSVYLFGTMSASPAPFPQLALLRDIHKDVTEQQSNVETFPTTTAPNGNSCFDYDVSPDNQHVLCSAYTLMGPAIPSTITLQPFTGGMPRVIYSNLAGGSIVARFISNSTILFILNSRNGPATLWKMNSDGSGLTKLLTAPDTDTGIGFAYFSYLPWSISSRDGRLYALETSSMTGNAQSLLFGSLNGGSPRIFATSTDSLMLVGWA